ncbi:MAG: 8-oxoguanine deaminase [Pseudomonadota bacterium]
MTSTLIKNADVIVTMDQHRRELAGGFVLIKDGVVADLGEAAALPQVAGDVSIVDGAGCVVTPGLVNTHHHLFQSLTRAVPQGASKPLFGWLTALYQIWPKLRPEDFALAAQVGLSELALSGCTMSSDHQYFFPEGVRLDDTIEAAKSVGVRFHATRGSMSIGESGGGLPPDSMVENEDAILADCERVIAAFHDPEPGAMVQVAVAPCSPFSVSKELMAQSAALARKHGLRLHTHLAENDEDVRYSLEHFGCRPGQYAEELGWVGEDVWHAHCVQLDQDEVDLFARTKTGVAHCPYSNSRLGSGIAPIASMRDQDVPVGLGVDGSASSDAGHLLAEARHALMLQRLRGGAEEMEPRAALELATLGGARVLGRDDCGALAKGMRADIAVWSLDDWAWLGAWDPVAALVLTGPHRVRDLFVEGRRIVEGGVLQTLDRARIGADAKAATRRLQELTG